MMNSEEDFKLAQRLQEEEYLQSGRVKESFLDVGYRRQDGMIETNDYANPNVSLVDPDAELKDPTPDVHKMFVGFDKRFFWGKLTAVEVKWSPRMTLCAGICRYRSRNGACSIHLSLPLLKLRPRKDLVETLLHEMIHAYLFVTHNNRDRDGHGPEFCSHMNRINREAGTNITEVLNLPKCCLMFFLAMTPGISFCPVTDRVYHSFHAEVNIYKTHWWKCNGRCQTERPFYGIVRRSTNRAPGPNDLWWARHQQACGGTFIKIREPENYKKKGKEKAASKTGAPVKTVNDYFPPSSLGAKDPKYTKTGGKINNVPMQGNENIPPSPSQPVADVIPFSGKGFVIGTSEIPSLSEKPWLKRLDAVFGKNSQNKRTEGTLTPFLKRLDRPSTSVGTGGSANKQLISPKSVPSTSRKEDTCSEPKKLKTDSSESSVVSWLVVCPVCQNTIEGMGINEHLDTCLNTSEKQFPFSECIMCESGLDEPSKEPTICKECRELVSAETETDFTVICEDRIVSCVLCQMTMRSGEVERHLENCDAICFKNV